MAQTPDPGSVVLPGQPDPGSVVLPSKPPAAPPPFHPQPPRAILNLRTPEGMQPALQAVLERSGQIIPAGIHRGPSAAWDALIHGVRQPQYETDVRAVSGLPPTGHGLEMFGNEMAMDPLTYFGLSKSGEKLVDTLGPRIAPAVMRTAQGLAQRAPLGAARDFADWAGKMGGRVHDFFTPGGQPVAHAMRTLMQRGGAEGARQSERMVSAAAGAKTMGSVFTDSLTSMRNSLLRGMKPQDEGAIYKAIHQDKIDQLPPNLKKAALGLQAIDRSIPWVFGTKTLRTKLTNLGFKLPEPLQQFDTGGYGILSTKDFMQNHVPMPHELSPEQAEAALKSLGKTGGRRAATDIRNRFFQSRGYVDPRIFEDPAAIREVWERSFNEAGNQYQGATLRQNLFDVFGKNKATSSALGQAGTRGERAAATAVFRRSVPGAVRRAYGKQPGKALTPEAQMLQTFERMGNLGKSTLFLTPFPHQRNISTLLALANPRAIPGAIANYARVGFGFASPTTKAKVLGREGMQWGATGSKNIEQTGLTNALERLGPPGKLFAHIYRSSGKMLWTWDDAAKKSLNDFAKKRFPGDPGRAAAYVRRVLVDYGNSSPAQEMLRLVFPFATWRTAMPKAVLESFITHPENAIALDRATHGAITGAPFPGPGGKKYQSYNPLAEAGELIPPTTPRYLRGALSLTGKVGANVAAKALGQHEVPFPWSQVQAQVPVLGQAEEYSGKGPYHTTPAQEALFTLAGIHPYMPPKKKHRPIRPRP